MQNNKICLTKDRGCNTALPQPQTSTIFSQSGNGLIWIFRVVAKEVEPCCEYPTAVTFVSDVDEFDPLSMVPIEAGNPEDEHLEHEDEIVRIWHGKGLVKDGGKSQYKSERFGIMTAVKLDITIDRTEADVQVGDYVFVERMGDLEGGEIMAMDRSKATMFCFTLDTNRVVPFSPELVQIREWPRGPQF